MILKPIYRFCNVGSSMHFLKSRSCLSSSLCRSAETINLPLLSLSRNRTSVCCLLLLAVNTVHLAPAGCSLSRMVNYTFGVSCHTFSLKKSRTQSFPCIDRQVNVHLSICLCYGNFLDQSPFSSVSTLFVAPLKTCTIEHIGFSGFVQLDVYSFAAHMSHIVTRAKHKHEANRSWPADVRPCVGRRLI